MATKADLRSMILKHDPDADVKNLKHSELVALLNKVDDTPAPPVDAPQEAKLQPTAKKWGTEAGLGSARVSVRIEVDGVTYRVEDEIHSGSMHGHLLRDNIDTKEKAQKYISSLVREHSAGIARNIQANLQPWTEKVIQ